MSEKFNAAEKDDDEISSRTCVMICSKRNQNKKEDVTKNQRIFTIGSF